MPKIPLITIIGVPNTGKSTLFNRLIGKRKALVHSQPGMTRDIYREKFQLDDMEYHIQDSGGFFLNDDIISEEVNRRIHEEARASDLIIFIFDGKRELLGYEKDLYLDIKKINSHIILVVNKVDHPASYILPNSYYTLKQDLILLSAEHHHGLEELLEKISHRFHHYQRISKIPAQHEPPRLAIVGKPNVGKSSIINKLLNQAKVIVSPLPGTTRDSVDIEIKHHGRHFVLVDNAGIRKLQKVRESTESAAVIRAEKDMKTADIIIFVVDVSRKIDHNDLYIADKVLKTAKPVIIAGNKCDLYQGEAGIQKRITRISQTFNLLYYALPIAISAKTGKNIQQLLALAESIDHRLKKKVKTAQLNKTVRALLSEKKITTTHNAPFNPKYVSIESYRPFFIRFQAHNNHKLKPFYEIYLKKRLLEELELQGVPIYFKITSSKSA